MSNRVFFYVQHLLGIGHLKRATTLARAMTSLGLEVTLVSGGEEVPVVNEGGMEFIQLPPLRAADRSFAGMVDAKGEAAGDRYKSRRRDKLLRAFEAARPDVLIIELYPFGRRQLKFELQPLLEAAHALSPRPTIVSSVRDILVEKNRPERDQEMVEAARTQFDHILIHGDPDLIPFNATFAPASQIEAMLHYTGYVVEKTLIEHSTGSQGSDEVIVSSGSGAVGEILLRTAMKARGQSSLADKTWRFLAGYSLTEEVFQSLRSEAPDGVIVERARADFVNLLKNCRLSISQGGYNTVMEVLATGAKGIAVPYAGGNETEQTLRARLLEQRGLIRQIPEGDLSVEKLVHMIEQVVDENSGEAHKINLNGAEETARLVSAWAGN